MRLRCIVFSLFVGLSVSLSVSLSVCRLFVCQWFISKMEHLQRFKTHEYKEYDDLSRFNCNFFDIWPSP